MTVRRRERGFLFEDFVDGRVFDHHWGRTFSQHDGHWFSQMTMQYNPLYFNAPYAQSLGYKDTPIHPLYVFSTALGLSVEDLSEAGGPFLGVDDLAFHEPVYAGDTIRASSVVLGSRRTKSRPGWGVVEWRTTARNQRDQLVLEFRRRNLSRIRSPDAGNQEQ